jgi:predicted nucleotidyltransferase component of viral defense system
LKTISTEQSKIIDAAATRIVELPARVLEKDVIITEALRAIAAVRTAGLTLTFSGGTCLAKAYKLLERMSEDIDLRVSLENPGNFTRSGVRTCLRKLKIAVTDGMRAMQFHIPDTAIRARNENQFMSFEVEYASRYPQEKSLRPSLRIELMAIAPRRATTTSECSTAYR